jgi:hypothetical protein
MPEAPYDSRELAQTIRTLLNKPDLRPESPNPVSHTRNNIFRLSGAGVRPIAKLASTSFVHVQFRAPSSTRRGNVPRPLSLLTPLPADTSSDRGTRCQSSLPATRWLRMRRRRPCGNLHRQASQVSGPKNCPGLVSRVTLRVCKSKASNGESLPW